MSELLRIEQVSVAYGAIEAVRAVSLEVRQGEIVALIGANGAGKTTLLRAICGIARARSGRILFEGEDITSLETHRIVRLGIAHAPEGRHVFPRMTVLENLQLGAGNDRSFWNTGSDHVFALFPILKDRLKQRAGTLSGGEQQMLAIGRALMAKPRLLLLDEPSLGLAPLIVRRIFDVIKDINEQDRISILLVEQNAQQALSLAHRGYVMANATIWKEGKGHELLGDQDVHAAYLSGARQAG